MTQFKTSNEIRNIREFKQTLWLSKEDYEKRVEEFRKEFNSMVSNMDFGRRINDLINKRLLGEE